LPATPVTDEPAALTAHVLSLGLIPGERIELEPARRPLDPSLSIPPEPPEVPAIA
jgi:hypothetical protein